MSINYDLWPNPDGQLGKNKIEIPDGVTVTWPEGDALIGNFIYKDGLLSGFVDYKALVANDSKTSHIPYDYAKITLDKSLEGTMSFSSAKPEYFIINYVDTTNSGDTITFKYKSCKTVDDIKAIDSEYATNDIIDGVWSESLADLTDGTNMFFDCANLTTFTSDLKSLTNGFCMFMFCLNLSSFNSDLKSLTKGGNMFYCTNFTSFNSDLKSLTYGESMFAGCLNLTSFTSNLMSLTNGKAMFSGCKLNTDSIKNIADTINDVRGLTNGNTSSSDVYKVIGIDIDNSTPTDEEHTYLTQIHDKGWEVYVNGSLEDYVPATATTDETGESNVTPIPFWAKPVPATEETAKYVDAQGNFFNILGGQFIYVNDPDTYGLFINEEDAATQMRLTKIKK